MYTLADIFKRELWTTEVIKQSAELINFSEAAFISTNDILTDMVDRTDVGNVIKIPYVQQEDYEEPSICNDDDSDYITDSKMVSKKEDKAYISLYAKSFSEADVVKIFGSGISLAEASVSLLGSYWKQDMQKRLASILVGVLSSNEVNEGGDLVHNAPTEVFSRDLVIDALDLVGDASEGFTTILAHSKITSRMSKNNDTSYIVDTENPLYVAKYDTLNIIRNDIFAPVDGVYTTVILKNNAFSFSIKTIDYPIETSRDMKANNGGGKMSTVSRMAFLLHPNGYIFNDDTISSLSPSLAELENPLAWTRNSLQKQTNFVFLKSRAVAL